MDQKIKKYFSIFMLNKKWLFLALLLFVIFGLFFTFQPALAQIGGLSCGYFDVPCKTANFIFSILIKIAVLIVFALPLMISAFILGIVALILGWIISPDFISLKFTDNAFVNIGLSITKGFANMGFILFLVVIALATILRIEEYKAKKTLTTLILIALLINFSPVLCGVVIDFSNIVMDFFLSNISGINGFVNIVMNAANSIWNSFWNSGLDLWANIAAAMQVIISIAFNYFATFIFILFCALFIMRYIMLWILVILSPIAFVSYILPITRRGHSLLNWRKWWEQLIAWSIIGIIAGFFLYLGFTMISLTTNNSNAFVTQSAIGQLGLMNNVLPYLIPLVLLWVAYIETKKTSAMFAGEIISATEKIGKTAVTAGLMIATAGASAAVGAATGAAKGAPGAVGGFQKKMDTYATAHPETRGGHVAGWMSRRAGSIRGKQIYTDEEGKKDEVYEGPVGKVREKAETIAAGAKEKYGDIKEDIGGWTERQKEKHESAALIGSMKRQVGKGLNRVVLGRKETGRELIEEEKTPEANGKQYRYKEEIVKTPKEKKIGEMEGYNTRDKKFKDPITGKERDATETEEATGRVKWEVEKKEWKKTDTELTKKEIGSGKLIDIEQKSGIMPVFKDALKTVDEGFAKALKEEVQKRLSVVDLKLSQELEKIKGVRNKITSNEPVLETDLEGINKRLKEIYDTYGADSREFIDAVRRREEKLEREVAKAEKATGIKIPKKISDFIPKIPRRKPKKDETRPPTPTPRSTGPGQGETEEGVPDIETGSSDGVRENEI